MPNAAMTAPGDGSLGNGPIIFTNTLVETIDIGSVAFIEKPFSCGQICFQCCCPCRVWVEYTGDEKKEDGSSTSYGLLFGHACLCCPCCCNWRAETSSGNGDYKAAGILQPAGCCDNGLFACCCPCFHTGRDVSMKFVGDDNNPKYSTRVDVNYCDTVRRCCGLTVCQLCTPLGYCYRFCSNTPYRVKTMPFYEEVGDSVDGDDGHKAIGNFVFVEQLKPLGCCCYTRNVRSSIQLGEDQTEKVSAMGVQRIALLSLYTELAKGLPVTNPVTFLLTICSGVPVPMGNSCADVGMNATTEWVTAEDMHAKTAAAAKLEQKTASVSWANQA